ncbi:hypothetical protein COOONC_26132 [Cooperia oncophora]
MRAERTLDRIDCLEPLGKLLNKCNGIVRVQMLFAAIALGLLLANVGAEPECLTFHALGELYKEFNLQFINNGLEYDPTLISYACDEAKNPGTTTIPNKFTGVKGLSQAAQVSQFDPKYAQPLWPA